MSEDVVRKSPKLPKSILNKKPSGDVMPKILKESSSEGGSEKKATVSGILRMDEGQRPRRDSCSSADFLDRLVPHIEVPSPQPSFDRLSVTFAESSDHYDNPVKINIFDPGSPPSQIREMEKVRFSKDSTGITGDENEKEEDLDDDYSASVSVIMQRRESMKRVSSKKKKRRTSSPLPDLDGTFNDLRRRSSEYTNSSGDTVISIENDMTQEQIFENIRLHKEVISNVKLQPWAMRRKVKLVQQAKAYVKRHEGELQERLAMSKSTKDILARFNIWLIKELQYLKRELANTMTLLIPWERRIKEIESHFGSAVASYFTFLRWMFWVNLVITVVLACFVAVPEMLTADVKSAGERKEMLPDEKLTATNLVTLWDFGGILKYSPIFYGYYTNHDRPGTVYRLPFAYFMTGLAVYVYSFVATLRRMAENSRMSKLSEKDDECIFTWKIFTGWDYMIGNAETAHNRVASLILGFKEALLEETERKKDEKNWKVICLRVLVSFVVLGLLGFSAYIVFVVVERSTQPEANDSWWRQNEITVSVSIISLLFPFFFELLGLLEGYHPRKSLRIQLARIMVLNLLNLYTLIFSQFWKISDMTIELQNLKKNYSHDLPFGESSDRVCVFVASNCSETFTKSTSGFQSHALPASIASSTFSDPTTLRSVEPKFLKLENLTSTAETLTSEPFEALFNASSDIFTNGLIYSDDENFLNQSGSPSYNFSSVEDWFFNSLESSTEEFNGSNASYLTTESTEFTENSSMYTTFSLPITKYEISSRSSSDFTTPSIHFTNQDYTMDAVTQSTLAPRICFVRKCQEKNGTRKSDRLLQPVYDMETRKRLRSLCWETMFGQELVKLTVMDLILTILSVLLIDFFRAIFVRVMNNCWCWDLEKKFPQYGDFKIAENILHLVYNQGMVWMGMFFSPGLPAINLIKLVVMMYLRSWAVLTCNVPHEVVFRASRSNNFYLALLLTMLFLCVLPVGFAIVWIEPSWHCGPFSDYERIYHLFTKTLQKALPKTLHKALDYIASPGIIIPLIMVLVLIIYYLVSLTNSLREANNDLKIQLRRERTEERRKMFQLVNKRGRKESKDSELPFAKWKKLLPELAAKQLALANDAEKGNKNENENATDVNKEINRKELLARLMKKALGKSSSASPADSDSHLAIEVTQTDGQISGAETTEPEISNPQNSFNLKPILEIRDPDEFQAGKVGIHRTKFSKSLTKSPQLPSKGVKENRLLEKNFYVNLPEIRISKIEIDQQSKDETEVKETSIGKTRFITAVKEFIKTKRREEENFDEKEGSQKVRGAENLQKDLGIDENRRCPIAKEELIPKELKDCSED